MQTCRVDLAERSYDIIIGAGVLNEIGTRTLKVLAPSKVAIITDSNLAKLYAETVRESFAAGGVETATIEFPAGEAAKSPAQLATLYEAMFEAGLDRKSCVVALGGGVTGDLAGYAAATFLRGIPFVQVPTSLLAQVDSSSGGKTGINHPRGKNLIGAFHQPALVLADPSLLQTLPTAELLSGLAEVVKHGMIRDTDYFAYVEAQVEKILALDMQVMAQVILGSCRIKGAVVAADEKEAGLRQILNFGHTFGHAYEKYSQFGLRHGEAVAAGMVSAAHLAEDVRGTSVEVRARLCGLLTRLGLPVSIGQYPADELLTLMYGDKKTSHGQLHFVLARKIGEAEVFKVSDENAVRAAITIILTKGITCDK